MQYDAVVKSYHRSKPPRPLSSRKRAPRNGPDPPRHKACGDGAAPKFGLCFVAGLRGTAQPARASGFGANVGIHKPIDGYGAVNRAAPVISLHSIAIDVHGV